MLIATEDPGSGGGANIGAGVAFLLVAITVPFLFAVLIGIGVRKVAGAFAGEQASPIQTDPLPTLHT